MKIPHLGLVLSLLLFVAGSFCNADDHKTVEVVGFGECIDCAEKSIKTSHAFSGLGVTIDCKTESGTFERRGSGKIDEEGKFSVSIPEEIVKAEGGLKEECYAQLHNAKAAPCAAHDGLASNKVVSISKTSDGKQTFGISGTKLKFSPSTCPSAFFGHHKPLFKFPPKIYPPFPPKVTIPPFYKKPCPPKAPVPVYVAPPVPVYKKPNPPSVPKKKPCPPKKKPQPSPAPVYKPPKKIYPPPVPVKKPTPTPSPVPVYPKPSVPVYPKPLPPAVPYYKPKPHPWFKPLPPFPKIPQHPWFKKPPPARSPIKA